MVAEEGCSQFDTHYFVKAEHPLPCKLAIDMHVMADKYGVQGLKELSSAKLEVR